VAGQHARRMYPPPARTITNKLINGPWDMTAADHGNSADLYVSNLLNGTVAADGATVNHGTVVRIELVQHRVNPSGVQVARLWGR